MATKRGTRAKAVKALSTPLEVAVATTGGLTKMVVVRESDASDLILFEDMVYKTISILVPNVPKLVELLEDPLGPIREPEKYNAALEKRRDNKSVRFVFEGILFVYHLGSAVGISEEEDGNFFTDVLLGCISEFEITEVYAFAMNRLVRDERHGGDLGQALHERGARVITNGIQINFAEPFGMTLWSLMTTFAAQDRDGIVERNRLGRVAVARRNQWPHGPNAIPLGYRLDGRSIIPVAEERARVRNVLELMGDPELSSRQFVEQLGMIEVSRPGVKERYGEGATVAIVRHPKDIYQSFVNMMPLYETGVYEMPLPNPTKGARVFGGLPVHGPTTDDPTDYGFVVLRYQFGLPEGGWAPPEVFEAIRAKSEANRAFVNGNRERRPFGGRSPYVVDGVTYQLMSSGADRYTLFRLEGSNLIGSSVARSGNGEVRKVEGRESLASIAANRLHREVINTIVDTLSSEIGAKGEVVSNALHVDVDPATKLSLTIAHHRHRADRAREEALRTDDAATAAAFRRDAEREELRITELLASAKSNEAATEAETDVVRVDIGGFIALLAKIATVDRNVPGAVVTACQRLIPDLQLFPIGEADVLGWSATVHIPTEDGDVLVLTDIRGIIGCNVLRRSLAVVKEPDEGFLALYSKGLPIEAIATVFHMTPEATWQNVRQKLREEGFSEGALTRVRSAPVPELRMLFGLLASSHAVPDVRATLDDLEALATLLDSRGLVPVGCEPGWAAGTLALYSRELSPRGRWSASNERGQFAVDVVRSEGDSCTVEELLAHIGPTSSHSATALAKVLGRYGSHQPAVLEIEGSHPIASGKWIKRDAHIRLVDCPHCGMPLTLVLRVTEVPRHLLCEYCHRSPTATYRFPDSYFTLERGATGFLGIETSNGSEPPQRRRSAIKPRREVGAQEIESIISDYRSGMKLVGNDGLLAIHGIESRHLYEILEERGVKLRQPFRPRLKER